MTKRTQDVVQAPRLQDSKPKELKRGNYKTNPAAPSAERIRQIVTDPEPGPARSKRTKYKTNQQITKRTQRAPSQRASTEKLQNESEATKRTQPDSDN